MRVIKRLSEQILDEVEGVEDYAKDALTWRGTDDKLSRTYHELAEAEYGHVQRLADVHTFKAEVLADFVARLFGLEIDEVIDNASKSAKATYEERRKNG